MQSRDDGRKRNALLAGGVAFFAFWPQPPCLADWPQFRGDPQHSAAASMPANVVLVPRWTVSLPPVLRDGATRLPAVVASPAVVNAIVYVASRNGHVYALDAATGEQRWDVDAGSGIDSSPLARGGRVYVAVSEGRLLALDAETGERVWAFATGGSADRASPNVSGNNVIGGAGWPANAVYAVPIASSDPATADWRYQAPQPAISSPAMDPSTGSIYVGCNDGRLYALKPDGTPLWASPFATIGGVQRFSPTVENGRVYFCGGDYDWALHCVDASTGTEVWNAAMEPLPVLPSWAYRGIQVSSPASDGDFVALVGGYSKSGSGPSTLYAFRDTGTSGTRLWTLDIPNSTAEGFVSSPALTPHHVIVGSAATYVVAPAFGRLYVADRRDGSAVWYSAPGPVLSSPAIADGAVFIGDSSGAITRFDARVAGDLNADGVVTVLDVLRLSVPGADTAVADVAPTERPDPNGSRSFGDGLLTPADADRLLAFAVGAADRLP